MVTLTDDFTVDMFLVRRQQTMATLGPWEMVAVLTILLLVTPVYSQARDRRPLVRPQQVNPLQYIVPSLHFFHFTPNITYGTIPVSALLRW